MGCQTDHEIQPSLLLSLVLTTPSTEVLIQGFGVCINKFYLHKLMNYYYYVWKKKISLNKCVSSWKKIKNFLWTSKPWHYSNLLLFFCLIFFLNKYTNTCLRILMYCRLVNVLFVWTVRFICLFKRCLYVLKIIVSKQTQSLDVSLHESYIDTVFM